MTSVTVPSTPETPGRSLPLRRIITIISMILLIFFAFIEVVPFVLTVANSFKCLPNTQVYPAAFIPTPPCVRTTTSAST